MALGASEHCGIMNAFVALAKSARSARRDNILVAIVVRLLLMCFAWCVSECSKYYRWWINYWFGSYLYKWDLIYIFWILSFSKQQIRYKWYGIYSISTFSYQLYWIIWSLLERYFPLPTRKGVILYRNSFHLRGMTCMISSPLHMWQP